MNRSGEALDPLLMLNDLDPVCPRYLFEMGEAYKRTGMTDEACLQFASAAGALNSLGLGASSYIRSEEMVLEFIRKTRQKHIAH